ncbi:MAG: FtsW/RodA/SpoVE family cell cycle protein [Treponema sp.]|jgi:cell division protein FtsW|nr:FtsW/RodA/SpoVE family cell cycle protein [Treponema sp.]
MAFTNDNPSRKPTDPILVSTTLLFAGLGFITLYSASNAPPEYIFPNGNIFANVISTQITCEIIGLFFFIIASFLKWEIFRKPGWSILIIFAIIFLCISPGLPFIGREINGARRWIYIGAVHFQPSELLKIILPLYFAHIADKKQQAINERKGGIQLVIILMIVLLTLVSIQEDLSTAALIGLNFIVLFICAGGRRDITVTACAVAVIILIVFIITSEERTARIISFINQSGFQATQSQRMIRQGHILGTGIGQRVEEAIVPETTPDFIFSYFAERFGFLGVLCFFILFGLWMSRAIIIIINATETFRRLLATGAFLAIAPQVLLTVGVASGIFPVTGVPLPFFSSGGTSLIVSWIAAGILFNVSQVPQRTGFSERGGRKNTHFSTKKGGWDAS